MLSTLEEKLSRKAAFRSRYTPAYHIAAFILIVTAMILTLARVSLNTRPTTRADTIAIAMGAKSLLFLLYQHLSAPGRRFSRFWSLRANAILNGLEIVFWFVVFGLSSNGLAKGGACVGAHCALGAVVVVLAALVVALESCLFVVGVLDFRYWKAYGKMRGELWEC